MKTLIQKILPAAALLAIGVQAAEFRAPDLVMFTDLRAWDRDGHYPGHNFHGLFGSFTSYDLCMSAHPPRNEITSYLASYIQAPKPASDLATLGCAPRQDEISRAAPQPYDPKSKAAKAFHKQYGVQEAEVREAQQSCAEARRAQKAESEANQKRAFLEGQSRCVADTYTIERELDITQVSKDGLGWRLEGRARAKLFSYLLLGGGNEIAARANVYLESCDQQPIARTLDTSAPLSEVVAQLENFTPKEFWSCRFRTDTDSTLVRDVVAPQAVTQLQIKPWSPGSEMTLLASGQILIQDVNARRSGEVAYGLGGGDQIVFTPTQRDRDPQAREAALAAVRRFVSLIKEHGRLIATAATSGMSKGELENVVAASILQRKPEILRQLALLNANYAQLATIDKLSVSVSVGQAYEVMRQIEIRTGQLVNERTRLGLDELMDAKK